MSSEPSSGRFQKKYLTSVNKNTHSSSPRTSNAKFLTTGSKISAPKPLNLPSLRHESSKASPESTCSASGESDSHSTSIVNTPAMINRWGSPLQQQQQQQQQHTTSGTSDSDTKSKDSITSSPISHQHSPSASPAWSNVTNTKKIVSDTHEPSTTTSAITAIPSPPCNSTPKNTLVSPKKDHVKVTVSHHAKSADIPMPFTQASEPSNMSWDEMVSEEMDFNVSVVDDNDYEENDDDNEIKLEDQESGSTGLDDNDGNTCLGESQSLQQPVSPSDRFTDDYDRSYPSTSKRTSPGSLYNSHPQETYRHQDRYHHYQHHHHHFHDSYNNINGPAAQGGGKWSSERRGSEHSNTSGYRGQRRSSSSSLNATGSGWNHHNDQQRRVSQDRPKPPPSPHQHHDTSSTTTTTTLLRRPSDNNNNSSSNNNGIYSTSDDRPPEIVAAQRQAMLSAAEQAKKRREADEAERQAAAARARQKALALAPPSPPVSKPLETTPPPSPDDNASKTTTTPTPTITILTNVHKVQPKASNKSETTQPTKSTDDTADTEMDQQTPVPRSTPVVKKGTLITTTTASTGTHHLYANKPRPPLTKDEKSWENYVNQIKKAPTAGDDDREDTATTVSDWSSFAQRLQRSTEEKKTPTMKKDSPTTKDSLVDQQPQQVLEPELTLEKMDKTTTTSSSAGHEQQQDIPEHKNATTTTPTQIPEPPAVANGVVKSDATRPRRFTKPNARLDKTVFPIFPYAIGRLVVPKPTSLRFMIDPDESDDEILNTLEHHYRSQADSSPVKLTMDTSTSSSPSLIKTEASTMDELGQKPPSPTPPPLIKSETTTDRVESSPRLDDHVPISQQRVTTMEDIKQSTPATSLDDQVPDLQHTTTTITEKTKERFVPVSKSYDENDTDDSLYPKGLPVPGPFGTISPASITPASIHTTLSKFDLSSGYSNDTFPPPHNQHYPVLMYPLQARPATDILKMGSVSEDQYNQSGFSVVLLPPGNTNHHSTKHGSSYRRKGNNRPRGGGGRGKHRQQYSASSSTGSWRATDSTNADRPTTNIA